MMMMKRAVPRNVLQTPFYKNILLLIIN